MTGDKDLLRMREYHGIKMLRIREFRPAPKADLPKMLSVSSLISADQRAGMLTLALSSSTEIYKENSRILSLPDDKAQKTATLAGIFLAAGFAFLRNESLNSLIGLEGLPGLTLLSGIIGLLVLCIFLGGLVIWAQKMQLPPNPNKLT